MKTFRPLVWSVAAMTFAAVAGTQQHRAEDQVLKSFDRSFGHEAAPAVPVTGTAIDQDVLYALINRPLQSPDKKPTQSETLIAGADK